MAAGVVAKEDVLTVLKQLTKDIRDLDVGTSVERHQKLPVVQFLRDFVAANKPVVLTSVVSHWPAYSKWTDDYLCTLAGDTEVTVALTPNGRADAVTPLPGSGGAGTSGASSQATSPGSASPTAAGAEAAAAAAAARADADPDGTPGSGGTSGSSAGDGGGEDGPAEVFALPYQVKMPLRNFLALLRSTRQQQGGGAARRAGSAVVPYLQFQNSSLTAEVPQLSQDVDLLLSWATQAFGGLPEAVNLWIGDERSVTSWHKDPFENIYAVVAGTKTFTLMPPADMYRMRLRRYSQATYKPAAGAEQAPSEAEVQSLASGAVPLTPVLHDPAETVLWSSVLPTPDQQCGQGQGQAGGSVASSSDADPGAAPQAAAAAAAWQAGDLFGDPELPPPLRVIVKAGEALYLPAMWWHLVEQEPDETGRAIAVNYWYDMKFDCRAAYLQAVERLAELLGLNEAPPPPPNPCAPPPDGPDAPQLRPPYTSTRAFG